LAHDVKGGCGCKRIAAKLAARGNTSIALGNTCIARGNTKIAQRNTKDSNRWFLVQHLIGVKRLTDTLCPKYSTKQQRNVLPRIKLRVADDDTPQLFKETHQKIWCNVKLGNFGIFSKHMR